MCVYSRNQPYKYITSSLTTTSSMADTDSRHTVLVGVSIIYLLIFNNVTLIESNVIVAHATGFLPVRNIPRASLQSAPFYTADQPKIKQVQVNINNDLKSKSIEGSRKFGCRYSKKF